MKISLRHLVVAISGAVLLLLAGFMGFQEMNRQHLMNSTRFTEQYARVVRQLSENIHSVQKRMERNDAGTAVAVVDIHPEPEAVSMPGPVENERKVTLQGISWSIERPLVIIENRTYKTGDTVGGYTIQKILPQAIILKNADGVQKEIALTREKQP